MSYFPNRSIPLKIMGQGVSHTGNTNETTLDSFTLKANTLGYYDAIFIQAIFSYTNSANNKNFKVTLGASNIINVDFTTSAQCTRYAMMWANGALNSQVVANSAFTGGYGTVASAITTLSEDLGTDLVVAVKTTLANAGETATIAGWSVILHKNP